MDNTIRKNERCIVGLPRCDFVFSSTRTCFIAYGFAESTLEMDIIRTLLKERGIHAVEAGGELAPGQNAFCAKICSSVITSQFCIVLLNNEVQGTTEIPNANVNMEYGMMLGFNKYVIPFQRDGQQLPFNVAGLDTVKYTNENFQRLAASAIDQAVSETQQESSPTPEFDQVLHEFLLSRGALMNPIDTYGDKNLFQLGQPLGFNLLNDFSGMKYMFFGNFTTLRPENVIRRINTLTNILSERRGSMAGRITAGIVTKEQAAVLEQFFGQLEIWISVTGAEEKAEIIAAMGKVETDYKVEVFTVEEMEMH